MAHFVADFLPLNGNDFFDMAGEMPPQLRVLLNVPEDFDESFFKYDDAGAETERKTWFENQDKLKELLIERYRNAAAQRLRGMRQGRNLGSIGVYNRVIELDAGVTMQYASLWGREYVTLIFAEWLVRRLLEKITPSSGRAGLLVLFKNNKIALLTINDSAKTASTMFILRKVVALRKSSWAKPEWWDGWFSPAYRPTFFLKTAQIKISKKLHAMTCSIKIKDGVISLQPNMEQRPMFNVADTIHRYAESTTPYADNWPPNRATIRIDGFLFGSGYYPLTPDPIMNGEDNYIYNEKLDKFEVKDGKIERTESRDYSFGSSPDFPIHGWDSPSAIESNGNRWGVIHLSGIEGPVIAVPFPTAFAWWYTLAQHDKYQDYANAANNTLYRVRLTRFGPGDSDVQFGLSMGTVSTSTKVMVYARTSGGIDRIDTPSITASVTSTGNDSDIKTYNQVTVTSDLPETFDVENYPFNIIAQITFPYQRDASAAGSYYRIDRVLKYDGTGYGEYHTPYESWTTPIIGTGVGNPEAADSTVRGLDPFYQGWLQLSNGKHMIQGYLKNGQRRIFKDGVDAGEALAKAIGCQLEDIVTMFMDVKESDIDKLK